MRNIYITGTIELKTVNETVAALRDSPDGDVTVWICSEGGDAYAGLGLYDVLHRWNAAGHEVETRAVGSCSSAAVLPFLAGESRLIAEHCVVTTHPMLLASDDFEPASEWKEKAYHLEKIGRDMAFIYGSRQVDREKNFTVVEWQEYLSTEKHVDGFVAYTLGLATGLL